MYSTCLFCHSALGANEVVEHFPVGRRLAFDGEKGRLWVICRGCERWNLTPLEERWEAIEECERLFRDTKLRMSTEHIGLARVSEGLELVRIGDPQRPEMAAWRYGDQFGKRRRKYYMMAAGTVVAGGALVSGYAALGLLGGGGGSALSLMVNGSNVAYSRRIAARVPTPDGVVNVTRLQASRAKIVEFPRSTWRLSLEYQPHSGIGEPDRWGKYRLGSALFPKRTMFLDAQNALPAIAALLPRVNARGGTARRVQAAVKLVEDAGSSTMLLNTAVSLVRKSNWYYVADGRLLLIPLEARLALEMATHEDDERRALEGELAVLEERWKEAEEIAGISDNMFLPSSVTDWIQKIRS